MLLLLFVKGSRLRSLLSRWLLLLVIIMTVTETQNAHCDNSYIEEQSLHMLLLLFVQRILG